MFFKIKWRTLIENLVWWQVKMKNQTEVVSIPVWWQVKMKNQTEVVSIPVW